MPSSTIWISLLLCLSTSLLFLSHFSKDVPSQLNLKSHLFPFKSSSTTSSSPSHWFDDASLEIPHFSAPLPQKPVLFVIRLYDLATSFDKARTDFFEAALATPGVQAEIWGPGWAGWDDKLDAVTNIENKYGCGYFDWVYWTWPPFKALTKPFGCGTIFIHKLADCIRSGCFHTYLPWAGNITVTGYSSELIDHFGYDRLQKIHPGSPMQLFGHLPDCGNAWEFYPRPHGQPAKHNVTLFGTIWDFYPLRNTVSTAHSKGLTWIHQYEAPQAKLPVAPEMFKSRISTYAEAAPFLEMSNHQSQAFAQGMRESTICLFDGSLQKKLIRKYAQAMLSGCVVASSLPTEHEEALRHMFVRLDDNWDIDKIHSVLEDALSRPAELERKAKLAYAWATEQLECHTYVEKLCDFVAMYRRGVRGYIWPTGFSATCRMYRADKPKDSFDPYYMPPWCSHPDQHFPDTFLLPEQEAQL